MRTTRTGVRPATRRKPSAHSAKPRSSTIGEAQRSTAKPGTTVRISNHGPQQALRDSELRYRRLFEAAQDGILILDAKTGAIDDVNPYLIDMLGYTREEMLDKKLWEVGAFKDVEASKDAFEQLQKADYIRYQDLPLKSKDGRLVQVEFVSNVYRVDHKAVIQCNIRNTTERMVAQQALRESEDRLRALFAGMTDVVSVYDADGRYLEIAPSNPGNLARPASEMLGRTVDEFFPPDEARFLLEHIRQVLKTGQPTNVDYSLRLGGQLRWFSAAVSPLSSSSVIWVAHDVTERKLAEEALKDSETRFRSLIASGLDNISLLAADGALLWESPSVARNLGYASDALVGDNMLSLVHPDDLARIQTLLVELTQQPQSHPRDTFRLRHSNGSWRWVEALGTNLLDEPAVKAIVINYRDVTERKEVEEKYHSLVDEVSDGLYVADAHGMLTFANAAMARILGFDHAQEVIGHSFMEFVTAAGLSELQQRYASAMQNGDSYGKLEVEVVRKDGARASLEIKPSTITRDGQGVGSRGIVGDITQRRQAAQATLRLAKAVDASGEVVFLTDRDGLITFVNPEFTRLYGYTSAEVVGKTTPRILKSGQSTAEDYSRFWQSLLGKKAVKGELLNKTKDGRRVTMESTADPILDRDGNILGFVAIQRDITERKQAEQALRLDSEIMSRMADGVYLVRASDGIIVYANPHFEKMFGYDSGELIGKHVSVVNAPTDKSPEEKARQIIEALNTDATWQGEIQNVRKDGTAFWCHASVSTFEHGEYGTVWITVHHDITERKQAELLQEAVYRIAIAAEKTTSLDDLFAQIHEIISSVMPAENFYVTLYDEKQNTLRFPYFRDAVDEPYLGEIEPGKGLTAYVLKTGKSLLCTQAVHDELERKGVVKLLGVPSAIWLGVPLIREGKAIGVMVVQHYTDPAAYGERERHMLEYVSSQIAVAISRKQAEEAVRESENKLRALFAGMTDVVIVYDADGRYLEIAPTKGSNLFRAASEFLGKTVTELFPPAEAHFILDQIGKALKIGELRDVEYSLRFGDQVRWFSAAVSALSSNSVIWVAHDITQRRQVEEQIRSRTDELSKLYELSRALANADDLDKALEVVIRQAVATAHVTFARVALLEGNELVVRAAYPIRVLEHDLLVGKRMPVADLPCCQRALVEHEPVILRASDPELGSDECASLLLDFAHTLCLVPLSVGSDEHRPGTALGLLMLGEARSEEREPFTPEKVRMAGSIGDQAATAIRRMLLSDETAQRLQHVAALHTIDQAISGSFDLHMILQVVLEQVTTQLGVDAASCLMLNSHTQMLEYAGGRGFRTGAIERSRLLVGEGFAGRAALERRTQIVNLAEAGSTFARAALLKDEAFVTYIGVPLMAKGQVEGVLDVFQRRRFQPDPEWLDFLDALAGQAAIAIDSATVFDNLQRSNVDLSLAYDATIAGWSRALDLRDNETEGHTQRVTDMALALARLFGLRDEELVHLRRGGLLHDIGKMGVPDGILLKSGPLTDDEWLVMKKHPMFAYEMLSPIGYLHAALDVPYCHHEKWDGSGYPRGLKGEQIPLAARIFAVVDVWDAVTSDRPYRKAWTEQKALEYIRSQAGTHLDPQFVKVFLASDVVRRSDH